MTASASLELPSLKAFHTTEQTELLDVIDSLHSQGLSKIIPLPQLIVCGDQSSGKSSVLEAISGVPFPRNDNLCTRFATVVILRRAPRNEITITILPASDRPSAEQESLRKFRHELAAPEDFPALFEKAKNVMGLSESGRAFSKDVLQVEMGGPRQPRLTLVDLPGFIHAATKSQTVDDVELVKSLVGTYLENPRSIILAVVSANNDIGNQVVLRDARAIDPQGKRTIGIITKPDLLIENSNKEKEFLALARNEDVKFDLGWHVVKNLQSPVPSGGHETGDTRDAQESAFFKESNFGNLPSNAVGIAPLRARLSKVLFNHIRVELPQLVADIESRIISCKAEREKLGPSRASVEEQRAFLIELSQAFSIICRDGVRGDYDQEFFRSEENAERRFCANLMNAHIEFADRLRKDGARWKIGDRNSSTRKEAIERATRLLKSSRGREV
jgi:GTPase SAR1 family protein